MDSHPDIVVDKNQNTVDSLINTLDIMGVCGNGASYHVLLEAEVQKADLLFLAGDMVTSVTGRECCYEGFLDALAANWQKAAYVLRGKHEYLGGSSGIFCDLVAPFKRTTYGAVYHKGVFFIMLDADIIPDFANEYFDIQKKWFARQIELAKEVKLPIIVHDREAHGDTVDILKADKADEVGGILHCFSGSRRYRPEVTSFRQLCCCQDCIPFLT